MLTCSARESTGLDAVWERLEQHRALLESTGRLDRQAPRPAGRLDLDRWCATSCWASLREHPEVRALAPVLEQQVRDGTLTATLAAERLLRAFRLPEDPSGR